MIAVLLVLVLVVAGLGTLSLALARRPADKREIASLRREVRVLRSTVGRVRTYATAQADADPVAQVVLDEISRGMSQLPGEERMIAP